MASLGQPGYEMPDTELVVTEATTGKVLWTRKFDEGPPTYSFSPDGKTLAFRWRLGTKSASDVIKRSPELAEKARRMGEKAGDYLIQILNTETGNFEGQVLIETGEGSFRVNGGFVSGDWLTLLDSENRILFYSVKTGELKLHVFGEMAMVNPKSSIAVVQNLPGILSIEDLNVGKRIGELRFPSPIIHLKFTDDGSKLFVLTAAQEYYIFDAARLDSDQ